MKKDKIPQTTIGRIKYFDHSFESVLKKLGWDNPKNLYIEARDTGYSNDYLDYELVDVSESVWNVLVRNHIMKGDYKKFMSEDSGVRSTALGYALISREYYCDDPGEGYQGNGIEPPTTYNDVNWDEAESYGYDVEEQDRDSKQFTANVISRWILDDGTPLIAWAQKINGNEEIYKHHKGYPQLFTA